MSKKSKIIIRIIRDRNTYLIPLSFTNKDGRGMVSKARYLLEYINNNYESFEVEKISRVYKKIERYADIDFEKNNVDLSVNLLDEIKHPFKEKNENGCLFIEVNFDKATIKYCMTDIDYNIVELEKYLEWNIGEDWEIPNEICNKGIIDVLDYYDKVSQSTKKNIKVIHNLTNRKEIQIMSKKELESIIFFVYSIYSPQDFGHY